MRERRSSSARMIAIALEQVVAGTGSLDRHGQEKPFSHTRFTRALTDHADTVLRCLASRTRNTSSALTLVTRFGGGKIHTLTAFYHLANVGERGLQFAGRVRSVGGGWHFKPPPVSPRAAPEGGGAQRVSPLAAPDGPLDPVLSAATPLHAPRRIKGDHGPVPWAAQRGAGPRTFPRCARGRADPSP